MGTEGVIHLPNPWVAGRNEPERGEIIVHRKGSSPETVRIDADRTSFSYEAAFFAENAAKGRSNPEPPAMSWEDTLGNMQALDTWREKAGVVYEAEKPAKPHRTAANRPLRPGCRKMMKYGRIKGLDKNLSHLIMGCDNQKTYSHMAVMADDWVERGGNAFDTAHIYGRGLQETLLGDWITSSGIRESLVIIGKGAHTPNCHPEAVTGQLFETLERMKQEYLDIYLLHRDNPEIPAQEFVDVLNEHADAGRLKIFGGSNWSIERIEEANRYAYKTGKRGFSLISNNFSLARMVNPVWRGCLSAAGTEARKWLEANQYPNLSWSSQARGFFTELSSRSKPEDPQIERCWYSEDNFQRKARAEELAREKGVLPINIACAYVLCQPFPSFALIGPRTLRETEVSLKALEVHLSTEELKYLNLESEEK